MSAILDQVVRGGFPMVITLNNEQEEAGFLKKTEKVFLKDDAQNSTFEIVV